jgi:hypothetical protein
MGTDTSNDTALRGAKFSLDTYGDQVFDGHTSGEEWNGWACPYFTYDQACRIVEAHRERGWEAHHDPVRDEFVFSFGHDGNTDPDAFPAVLIGGNKLYPVGAFGWIWSEENSRSER